MLSVKKWKYKYKLAAGSIIRINDHCAAYTVGRRATYRKTESATLLKLVKLGKAFKHQLMLVGRYAITGVGH